MEKEFVNYELSLRMKALGFDEPCFSYYELDGRLSDTPKESGDDIKYEGDCKFDNHQNTYLDEDESCSAPTWQSAFRWFREKYGFNCMVDLCTTPIDFTESITTYYYKVNGNRYDDLFHKTYEEAELACLEKLIDIVENQ
jgi:hypothetical protein